jgi:RNA polymerase sigma-70 factor (ECF subfamily)
VSLELASGPVPRTALMDFESVYDAEADYVWVSLKRLGIQATDLPDLTQEVFLRAFRGWVQLDHSRPIRPWLFGVAVRVALDFRRLAHHRKEVSPSSGLVQLVDPARLADETLRFPQEIELFRRAIAALEPRRQAVFILHELDGYSVPEIAASFDAPLNTVYSRLRLAWRDLRRAMRHRRLSPGHE